MKVVICDDHAVFRDGLHQVLDGPDVECLDVDNGDALLAAVADPDVGLVLLDLHLPGSDGWTALRTLRREHPTLPVVIVSSSEDRADVRRAIAAGASGFIPKSSTSDVMRAALDLVRSGGVYVPRQALDLAESDALGGDGEGDARQRARHERALRLTPRQREVLRLLSRGLTNRDIAEVLGIAPSTVKTHIATLLEALDVSNRTEAALVLHELDLD